MIEYNKFQPIGYMFCCKDELTWEDVGTDILNFLGSIPLIGSISGIARMIFADMKIDSIQREYSDDGSEKKYLIEHYEDHIFRAKIEVYGLLTFGIGNLVLCAFDICCSAILLHDKKIKPVDPTEYLPHRAL